MLLPAVLKSTKKYLHLGILIAGLSIPGLLSTASGAESLNQPRRITTHPAEDRNPALSPDGKWLAFASDREGNWDIFLKPVAGGAAVKITSDLTDEYSPAWSPDGKRIAYVSEREDALGDVWVMKLKTWGAPRAGKALKITSYQGYDGEPVFAPQGKELCFVSDRSGQREIWLVDLKSRKSRRITKGGGVNPDISPGGKLVFVRIDSETPNGEVFLLADYRTGGGPLQVTFTNMITASPACAPSEEALVVSRVVRDSDRDGALTLRDNFTLWIVPLKPDSSVYKTEFQITRESVSSLQPFWSADDHIYYTYLKQAEIDISQISDNGYFRRESASEEQLATAEKYASEAQTFLLGLEAVKGYYPGSEDVAWAMYYKGVVYAEQGNYPTADSYFKRVIRNFGGMKALAGMAEIGHLQVISKYRTKSLREIGRVDNPTGYVTALDDIIRKQPGELPLVTALLLKANALFQMGVFSEAVEVYDRIIANHRNFPRMCAEAQFRKAEVFLRYGDLSEVENAFLQALEQYPGQEDWNRLAVERILELEAGGDGFVGLQRIMGGFRSHPRLTGWAKREMARRLTSQGQTNLALQEYRTLLKWPGEDSLTVTLRALSTFETADIRFTQGEFLEGMELMEILSQQSPRYREEAHHRLYDANIERGRKLAAEGDYELALAAFDRARNIFPDNLTGHRQYIRTMNLMSRGQKVYGEYTRLSGSEPDSPVLAYCRGLALSYIGGSDPVKLERSNELINQALALDYTMIPAYLTLSYNYQAVEELNRSGKVEIGFFRKAYRSTEEVLADFWRAITLQGEPEELSGYENAISALTQAIALNDERVDPAMEARLLQNLGNNFYSLGEYGFKLAFQSYYRMFRFSPDFESSKTEAVIYERMGRSGMFIDRIEEGRGYLKKAREIYSDLGDARSVFRVTLLQAELEFRAGDGETSNEFFQQAMKEAELARLEIPEEHYFSNIAFNWYRINDWDLALNAAQKSLEKLPQGKIPRPKKTSYKIGFSIFGLPFPLSIPLPAGNLGAGSTRMSQGLAPADIKSLALAVQAEAHSELADYEKAEAVLREKLKLAEYKKDRWEAAVCLNNLGLLLFQKGDYTGAADYFLASMEMNRKMKSRQGVYVNAANLQLILDLLPGDYENRNEVEQSLNRTVKSIESEDEDSPARLILAREKAAILAGAAARLFNAGMVMTASGGLEDVVEGYILLQRAVDLWEKSLERPGGEDAGRLELLIKSNLALVAAAMGDMDEALSRIEALWRAAHHQRLQDLIWRLQYIQGELLLAQGDSATASKIYADAAKRLEEITPEKDREYSSVQQTKRALYTRLVKLNLERRKYTLAFDYAERAAMRNMVETMAKREFTLNSETRKFYWSAGGGSVNFFRREIHRLEKELRRTKLKPEKRVRLEKKLKELTAEYRETLTKIQTEDPEFAGLFSVRPLSLDTIRASLDDEEVILRFFEFDSGYVVWAASEGEISAFTIALEPDSVRGGPILEEKEDSSVIQKREEFSQRLLKPLTDVLDFYSSLLIVPDGALTEIPFESLMWRGSLLCENYRIRYGMTAADFALARKKRKVPGRRIVCFGSDSLKVSSEQLTVLQYPRLTSENDFFDKLSEADYAVVRADFLLDTYPALNAGFTLPGAEQDSFAINTHSFFAYEFPTALVILVGARIEGESGAALLKSLSLSGIPSVIAINPQADRSTIDIYYRELFRGLNSLSPLEAHRSALFRCRESSVKGWEPLAVYFGDDGLNPQEAVEYAGKNFRRTVMLGNHNLQRGDYKWAGKYYRAAMEMARRLDDSRAKGMLLKLQLQAAFSGKDWEGAAQIQKRIINDGLSLEGEAAARTNLSHFLFKMNKIDSAETEASAAAELYIEAGQPEIAAKELRNFAHSLETAGDYLSAEEFAGRARALQSLQGLPDTLSTDLFRGKMLLNAGLPDRAAQTLTPLLESRALDSVNLAAACQFLGRCSERLADYYTALDYFRAAFDAAPQDSFSSKAAAVQGMSDIYFKLGDYAQALERVYQARNLFTIADSERELYLNYNTEGLIHFKMGRFSRALASLRRALELNELSADRESEANIHKNLTTLYIESEDYTRALSQTRRALEIDREVGREREQGFDHLILAGLQIKMGNPDGARTELSAAEGLNRSVNDDRISIKSTIMRGWLDIAAGSWLEARRRLQTAMEKADELGMTQFQWRAAYLIGEAARNQGLPDEALKYYDAASNYLKNSLDSQDSWHTLTVFLDDSFAPFESNISELLKKGDAHNALIAADETKQLRLRRYLRNRGGKLRAGQDYAERERSLRSKAIALREMAVALRLRKADAAEIEAVEAETAAARDEYSRILETAREVDPDYYHFILPQAPDLANVQRKLEENAALVCYFAGKEGIHAWLVKREKITSKKISLSAAEMKNRIEAYNQLLYGSLNIERESKRLYNLLLAPFNDDLTNITTVYVSPDGPLKNLTFDSLIDGEGRFLIECWEIDYCRSLGDFVRLYEPGAVAADVLVFADPAHPGARELEFARKEAASIDYTIPAAEVILGEAVTEEEVSAAVSGEGIAHLACHGQGEDDSALDYALLLTPDARDDGMLTARELQTLSSKADLVFLSACGRAGAAGSEEVGSGVTDALLNAGTETVISTLWKVDDLAAGVLAKRFYRRLAAGEAMGAALRGAKLFIKDEIHPHPAFWAAFVLYGNSAGVLPAAWQSSSVIGGWEKSIKENFTQNSFGNYGKKLYLMRKEEKL